jgi:hypothetical protein
VKIRLSIRFHKPTHTASHGDRGSHFLNTIKPCLFGTLRFNNRILESFRAHTNYLSISYKTLLAPLSTLCASNVSIVKLSNNEFIYSPTSRQYAAGMLNNQFGVYQAYGYANVTSTALWTAPQSSTSYAAYFTGQTDRNLVVYGVNTSAVYWTAGINNGGSGSPFCLEMLDTGNLIWIDNTTAIIWQSNTTVQSG